MNLCHFNSPDVAKKASDVVHLYAQKGEGELSHRTSKSTLPILLCNLVSLDVRMRTVYHSQQTKHRPRSDSAYSFTPDKLPSALITGKQISRSEGHTRPSSSNSSAIQLSPDTSMDIHMESSRSWMDISQENRLTLPSPSTVNIPPRIKSVNDTLDPSLSVAKSEVEVQETDLQIVRARNSNEFVVHMIQPESKSNNRKSVTTMESTEESDFGLH